MVAAGGSSGPEQFELHGSRILVNIGLERAGADAIRAALAGRRGALISDSNVMPLYGAPLADRLAIDPADRFPFPAGEGNKNRIEWSRLTNAMLNRGIGRDAVVIAVGGGVAGDLAGFVAATYMRGIPFIQVPTTLLAMIDASIGGKTGVDTPAGKNLVGAFHHPELVLIDPETLRTLPVREYRAGLAEALKHALIDSPDHFEWLTSNARAVAELEPAALGQLLRRSLTLKHRVVLADEREAGLRKTLNFGHTIGHALEALSEFRMLHGECIAIGMLVEARIAALLGVAKPALVNQVASALQVLGLPGVLPSEMTSDAVIAATRSDKKARGGAVEYALISGVGQLAGANSGYGTPVPDSVVADAIVATR